MNLFSQYKSDNPVIELKVINTIDSNFLNKFVNDYKKLLQEKTIIGNSFLEEEKTLKIIFEKFILDKNEDFDLTFISYLTLFKIEFENVKIHFHFISPKSGDSGPLNSTIFKLIHHKVHLYINTKKEIFKLFVDDVENTTIQIFQSKSYIPLLFIDKNSLAINFSRKDKLKQIINVISSLNIEDLSSENIFNQIQNKIYTRKGSDLSNWNSIDLNFLYLFKLLDELNILKHLVYKLKSKKDNYNIGKSIMFSSNDPKSSPLFRETIMKVIDNYDVLKFSDVEVYFLSIIIQNSKLFKIPGSIEEMYLKIEPLLNENEKKKCKKDDKFLKKKYIEVYEYNLKRNINYIREVCYGLEELAKNIVEHSGKEKNEGFGIISGRIYSFNVIRHLKNIDKNWLKDYNANFKYLDINVIDTGSKDVIKSYQETLISEKKKCSEIEDVNLRNEMIDAYNNDLQEINKFTIKNFFNSDSLKLLHQINRTKAKIGLLIFSQTILVEKKAFISIASSGIESNDYSEGFFLYQKDESIEPIVNSNYLNLGTNYNFTIPFNEKLEFENVLSKAEENRTSVASSVFLELFDYTNDERIRKFDPLNDYSDLGKYVKLEKLKTEIGLLNDNQILVLDFKTLNYIVQNSSDWFRFLSDLQFTREYTKNIIIINFDIEIYLELIQILKFYARSSNSHSDFWNDDRYILFFFPIKNDKNNVFWFNHLLYSRDYFKFLKINEEIGLYHQNLVQITQHDENISGVEVEYNDINSAFFSKSKKLLNFELLLKNDMGKTIFEESLKSMLNINVDNKINENN